MNFLNKLDLFGAYYQPTLRNQSKQYKTVIGAISTIIIYSLSMAYLTYQLVLWQTNKLEPTIITSKKSLDQLVLNNTYIGNISFFKGDNPKEPFQIEGNILTPILIYVGGLDFSDPIPLFDYIIEDEPDDGFTNQLSVNVSLRVSSGDESQLMALLLIIQCQKNFLPKGGYCASDEEINEYLNQPLLRIQTSLKLDKFNQKNQEIESFAKQNYLIIDPSLSQYTQISLQSTQIKINDGILFYSESIKNMVDNLQFVSQTNTKEYIQKSMWNMPVVSSFLFNIDNISSEMVVSYPRIGEILAEVGSIISVLLSLKIIFVEINQYLLENELIEEIIQLYFPDIKKLQIKRNCFSQIKEIKDQKNQQCNVKQFNEMYKALYLKAKKKITFLNLQNQIKEIQMILHQVVSHEQLRNAKKCKLKLEYGPNIKKLKANKIANQQSEDHIEIINDQQNQLDQQDQQDHQNQFELDQSLFNLLDLVD